MGFFLLNLELILQCDCTTPLKIHQTACYEQARGLCLVTHTHVHDSVGVYLFRFPVYSGSLPRKHNTPMLVTRYPSRFLRGNSRQNNDDGYIKVRKTRLTDVGAVTFWHCLIVLYRNRSREPFR